MKNVMGIIALMEQEEELHQITYDRTVAAIPFGGRYRLIDFILSSMVNSGITNVGLFPQNKYRSLMDHLRSGKPWDLHRKRGGLFILSPNAAEGYMNRYRGDLECIYHHLDYVSRSNKEYVILARSNVVCNMDFRPVYQFHQARGADVTVIYNHSPYPIKESGVILQTDGGDRVIDLQVKPKTPKSNKISMDMYLISKSLLLELVDSCIAQGQYDFVKDGLIKNLQQLKIMGYGYSGYVARIADMSNYYSNSLQLLQPAVWRQLFYSNGSIYTKVKDEPPTKYLEKAQVENSLVASGCLIKGTVKNSILFRGVKVAEGAEVVNSIIMPKGVIGPHAKIQNAVLDKGVVISERKRLMGDTAYPLTIRRNTVI